MTNHRTLLGMVLGGLLITAPANAQKVYINGVDCTGLVNARFEGATVTFDEQGNIRIDAPGYRVQVIQSGAPGTAAPGTTTTFTTTTTSAGTMPRPSAGQTVVYSDSGQAIVTSTASHNPPIVEQVTTTVVRTTIDPGVTTPRTTATAGPTVPVTTTGSTMARAGTGSVTPPTAPPAPPARPAGSPVPTRQYFLVTQGTGSAAVGETVQVNINGRTVRTVDSAGAQVIMNVTDWLNVGGNSVTMLSTKKPNYVPGSPSNTFQVIIGEGRVEAGGRVVIDNPVVIYTRTAADTTAHTRTFNLTAR